MVSNQPTGFLDLDTSSVQNGSPYLGKYQQISSLGEACWFLPRLERQAINKETGNTQKRTRRVGCNEVLIEALS